MLHPRCQTWGNPVSGSMSSPLRHLLMWRMREDSTFDQGSPRSQFRSG